MEPSCTGTFNPLTTSSHVLVQCSKTDTTLVLIYFSTTAILNFHFLDAGGSGSSAVSATHLQISRVGTSMLLAIASLAGFLLN